MNSAIGNNKAIGAVGINIDSAKGVSVEELLLVCESRMSDIDADVRRRLGSQQTRAALQAKIGNTLAEVKQLIGGKIENDPNKVNALASQIDAQIKLAESTGDQETATSLAQAKQKLTEDLHGGVDGKCSTEDIDAVKTSLENATKNASTNSELEMIEIQQCMSKRAQLLQMTTNMLNSMNESAKGIAQNIR